MIDASIYRGIQQPQAPDQMAQYGRMMQIRNMMDQGELAGLQRTALADDLAEQRSIKDYMSRADMTKPEMVIADIAKISPKTAWKMRQDMLAQQKDQSVIDKNRSEITQRDWQLQRDRTDYLMQQFSPVLMKYNELVRGGATPEQALATVQPQYAMARGGMVNSGMFPTQAVSGLPEQFDPAFVHNNLMATLKFKDQLENQRADTRLANDTANQTLIPNGQGGYTVNQPLVDVKKTVAREGRPSVNVSTEKKYGEQFAGEIAKQDSGMLEAARKAPDLAQRSNNIRELLSSGKVITGTGADIRLAIGKAAGLAGASDAEVIANTEVLMTDLARNTLDAIKASGLGAGNGFSNADRDFLEKAVGGKITLEASTIDRLAKVSHRVAELTAQRWSERAKQIPAAAIQGTGISTDPIQVPPLFLPKVQQNPAQPTQPTQPAKAGGIKFLGFENADSTR